MSGNSAIRGSRAKTQLNKRHRHWPGFAEIWLGPSLVNGTKLSRLAGEAVKDFIILTDFSRCQRYVIGRVSRRLKQPHKDFP